MRVMILLKIKIQTEFFLLQYIEEIKVIYKK